MALLEKVDGHIRSDYFWAYCHMVLKLHSLLSHINHLGEACPCHPARLDADRRKKELPQGKCAAMGCMAAFFAAGRVKEMLQEWRTVGHAELLLITRCLDANDTRKIMGDWQAGSDYIEHMVATKFVYWDKIPYRLCAVGHPDVEVARAALKDAYEQYDQIYDSEDTDPHRMSHKLCEPGCALRLQGERFLAGEPLDAFPEFELEVDKLFLSCVTERPGEALHSYGKAHTIAAHNWSEAYYSLGLRMPEIQQWFNSDKMFLIELGDCLAKTIPSCIIPNE